jgi:peptide/nickel transport system substrate-binding protein
MYQRIGTARRRAAGSGGFTRLEVAVIVVIVGLVAAAGVFALRDDGDRRSETAAVIDKEALQTAEEAFMAKNGRYGSEDELVAQGFLAGPSDVWDIRTYPKYLSTAPDSAYTIGYAKPNGGVGTSVDNLSLQSMTGFGVATPFRTNRGPGALVPHFSFDTLLWKDATGLAVPWLARAVPTKQDGCDTAAVHDCVSPDGLVWKFTLRDNVAWQDNPALKLTPADVKFTYDYFKAVSAASRQQPTFTVQIPSIGSINNDIVANGVQTSAEDPNLGPMEVKFLLNKPLLTFTTSVAQTMLVIPKHIWETVPYQATATVGSNAGEEWAFRGTGPYKIDSVYSDTPTTVVNYTAFADFWAGQPFVRHLTLKPMPAGGTVEALTTGYFNASGLGGFMGIGAEDAVTDAAVSQLKAAGLNSIQEPGNWSRVLLFNSAYGQPYTSPDFRKAVTYAIDRQQMVDQILAGRGVASPNSGLAASNPWLAPGLPTYTDDASDTQAKALLDAALSADPGAPGPGGGFRTLKDGTPFTMKVFYSTQVFSAQPAEWIKQKLEALGVSVELADVPNQTTADANAGRGQYPVYIGALGGLTGDPDTLRTRLASSYTTNPTWDPANPTTAVKNGGAATAFAWGDGASSPYTNALCPERTTRAGCFDYLATRQVVNNDQASRTAQVKLMQELVAADMPFITMYTPDSLLYYDNTFTAWYFTPGSSPVGPNTPTNKQALVTGKQFDIKGFNDVLNPGL